VLTAYAKGNSSRRGSCVVAWLTSPALVSEIDANVEANGAPHRNLSCTLVAANAKYLDDRQTNCHVITGNRQNLISTLLERYLALLR
jgi:hypothetical protein